MKIELTELKTQDEIFLSYQHWEWAFPYFWVERTIIGCFKPTQNKLILYTDNFNLIKPTIQAISKWHRKMIDGDREINIAFTL